MPGKAGRFGGLFDWDALSRLLETTPLEPPRIELAKGGRSVPDDAFIRRREGVARIDGGALNRLLDQGATLLVFPHVASALDGPSLHLTVALSEATAHGFLRWLGEDLRRDPRWRAALPGADGDDDAWLAALRQSLDAALTPAALDRYRAMRAGEKPARARFAFPGLARQEPAAWTGATTLRLASRRGLAVTGNSVRLGEMAWPCAAPVAAALGRLSDAEPLALATLEHGLVPAGRAELRRLLSVLHLSGALDSMPGGVP